MKLITNIKPSDSLSDILLGQRKNFTKMKAAVAYCENYELFEYCKKNKVKLDYYGRLDPSINLDLQRLKKFSTDDISIHIIAGSHFHPKVIWCDSYGAYIGSANLTKSAWEKNIECGLWLTHKELKNNHLITPLKDFFEYMKKKSKEENSGFHFLSNISDDKILGLNKRKQKPQSNKGNSQTFKQLGPAFKGVSNSSSDNPVTPKDELGPVSKGVSNRKSPRKKASNDKSSDRYNSNWNDINEMRCLLIFKKLKEADFPRGKQSELCKEMANIPNIGLSAENISAKVGNYKSVAGVNNSSNYSDNTNRIYTKHKNTSISELEKIIKKIQKNGDQEQNGNRSNTTNFHTKKAEDFFKELKTELETKLETKKEMLGLKESEPLKLKVSEPLLQYKSNIMINLNPIGYKNGIRAYRGKESFMEVYYGFKDKDKKYFEKRIMPHLIKNVHFTIGKGKADWGILEWDIGFISKKKRGNEKNDKQWIINRIIDLLKALRNKRK